MAKINYTLRALFLGLLVQGMAAGAWAGAPLKFNFQGRLNENGQPAEGAKNFVFKIYDVLSGGAPVWTSEQQAIDVSEGMFTTLLSTGSPADLSTATFSGARFIEITVDGVPLSPRQEMVSAPYALVAQSLAPDAEIPPASILAGSVTDYHVLLTTAAIASGSFGDDRVLISTGAFAGGFNGAWQLVQLDGTGKLPALDGSAITNVNQAYLGSVASDTTTLRTDLSSEAAARISADASVGVDTATLRTDLNAVIASTAPLANAADWDAAYSWGSPADVAVSTGVLTDDLNAEAAARISADASVGVDTATLRTDLDGVIASTAPLANAADWDAAYSWGSHADVAVSTGVLTDDLNAEAAARAAADTAIGVDTATLRTDLSSEAAARSAADTAIGVDTATLRTDLDAAALAHASLASTQTFTGANVFGSTAAFAAEHATLPGVSISSGLVVSAGSVGIGTASPNSSLSLAGALSLPIRTVTADYTATEEDFTIVADASAQAVTVTLPSAAGIAGRVYVVKAADITSGVSLVAALGETIDGENPYGDLIIGSGFESDGDLVVCQSDGVNWIIISRVIRFW